MRTAFIFLVTFMAASMLHAQIGPSIQWEKSLGGSDGDWSVTVQQTSDGGFIAGGSTRSNDGDVSGLHPGYDYDYGYSYPSTDYWIVKMDPSGNIEWQKCLGGSFDEGASSMQQTSDGGYVIAGGSISNDGDVSGNHFNYDYYYGDTIFTEDYWIVKLNSNGDLEWQKSLGGAGYDEASSIQQTTDGGFIVAGISNSNDGDVSGNHGLGDYWIVKLSPAGNIVWQKSLGGTGDDWALSIKQTAGGGYIVAGSSSSNDGDVTGHHGGGNYSDDWIVKLDSLGNLVWQKSLGGSNIEDARSIQPTIDGGYIVAGYSNSTDGDVTGNHPHTYGSPSFDYWIVKLDTSGNIDWEKSLGGSDEDFGHSVQQTSDSGFAALGFSSSDDGDVAGFHGSRDYWITKLDIDGNIFWQKCLGGSNVEFGWAIQQSTNGGFIVAGSSSSNDGDVSGNHPDSFNITTSDYWIVKLSGDIPTGIPSSSNNFISIYPDPATTQLNLSIGIPMEQLTQPLAAFGRQTGEAIVLNILGEQMMKQTISFQPYSTVLDISALPAGTYIIQLSTVQEVTIAKFVKE